MPVEETLSVKFKGDASDLEKASAKSVLSLTNVAKVSSIASQALESMQGKVDKTSSSIGGSVSNIQKFSEAIAGYFKNISQAPDISLDKITSEIDTLQEKINKSKASISVTADDSQIKKLQAEVDAFESRMASLKSQSIVIRVSDLASQFSAINSAIAETEASAKRLSTILSNEKLKIDADPTKIAELETELERTKAKISDLNNQKINIQADGIDVVNELNRTVESLQSRIASQKLKLSLETDLNNKGAIEKEIANIEAQVKSLKGISVSIQTDDAVKSINKLDNTIETLRGKAEALKIFKDTESDIKKIAAYNKEIEHLEDRIEKLKNVGKTGFDNLGNRVDKFGSVLNKVTKQNSAATQSLVNLSRVAQDAPFGFIAIANNLNPLLESFQRLQTESKGTGGALKALGASLIGPAGVGLALGIVSSLVLKFGDDISKAFSAANEAGERFKTIFSGTSNEFTKAASLVNELTINIDLAKKGVLSKEAVLKQYNSTIGETTGQVKSLDEAEKALTKNGDAYIKMMLFKAAANVALAEASKKAFELAQELNKPATTTELIEGGRRTQLEEDAKKLPEVAAAYDKATKALLEGNKEYKKFFAERDALVEAYVQKNLNPKLVKEQDDFLKIAQDFQKKAAEISTQFKFNFFDGGETKVPTKSLDDALKKAKEEIDKRRLEIKQYLSQPLETNDFQKELSDRIRRDLIEIIPSDQLTTLRPKVQVIPEVKVDYSKVPTGDEIAANVNAAIQQGLAQIQILGFTAIGEAIGAALSGGNIGSAFQAFAASIGDALQAMGKQIIGIGVAAQLAKESLKALFNNPALAIGAGIALVAAGAALKKALSGGVKGFAHGGLVFGPTLGLVGEGRGTTRSNPEIIAPLNKLSQFLGGGGNDIGGTLRLRGNDLIYAIARNDRRQRRVR